MTKAIRLGVTKVSEFYCKRRTILEVLFAENNIKPPFNPSKYLYAGKFLHMILQRTFLKNFSYVEYFYYREKNNLQDSILTSMNKELAFIKAVWFSNNGPWMSHRGELAQSFDIVESQMVNLAELAETLIQIDANNNMMSLSIQDEFTLLTRIFNNFQLKGKIDLVAFSTNGELRIIEYKTGRPKEEDENQIKIYGEILSKTFPKQNFILELWYSRYEYNGIKIIEKSNDSELINNIAESYKLAKNISSENDLPEQNFTSTSCQYCDLCDLIFSIDFEKEQT